MDIKTAEGAEPSLHERAMAIVRSPEYKAEQEAKRALQETCLHKDWNFEKHGRCCHTRGAFVVDFGD